VAAEIIRRKDALAIGRTRYFTGKPCKHGHIAERWSSDGKCVECTRIFQTERKDEYLARHKAWRAKNHHKVKAWTDKWRFENPEKKAAISAAYGPAYRLANKEAIRAAAKERYDADPSKGRLLAKEWRTANPEKFKATLQKWRSENPEKVRLYTNRRRVQKAEAGGSHTVEQIQDLFKKQKGKCAGCLCSIMRGWHNDHVIALSRGGSDDISNIQLLCQPCNQTKYNKDPFEWALQSGRLL
jgi:5-methylcytosine-specific restriction endonuclease McrA